MWLLFASRALGGLCALGFREEALTQYGAPTLQREVATDAANIADKALEEWRRRWAKGAPP